MSAQHLPPRLARDGYTADISPAPGGGFAWSLTGFRSASGWAPTVESAGNALECAIDVAMDCYS